MKQKTTLPKRFFKFLCRLASVKKQISRSDIQIQNSVEFEKSQLSNLNVKKISDVVNDIGNNSRQSLLSRCQIQKFVFFTQAKRHKNLENRFGKVVSYIISNTWKFFHIFDFFKFEIRICTVRILDSKFENPNIFLKLLNL